MISSPGLLFTTPKSAWYFITLCLLGNGLLRLILVPHAAWIDEAEQVYLSQWLRADAYEGQPPLYTWIHHLVFSLTGPSAWFVVLFKVVVLSLVYLGIWKICHLVREPYSTAIVLALLSFSLLFDLWDETPWRTNTILLTAASVWSVFLVIRITLHGKWLDFVWLGLVGGLGFLSKYTFLLHAGAIVIAALGWPQMRRRIFSPFLFLALFGFILTTWPHLVWLLERLAQFRHMVQAETGGSDQHAYFISVLRGLLEFIEVSVSFTAIWLVVNWLFFRKVWISGKGAVQDRWTLFFQRYLLSIILLIAASIIGFEIGGFQERYLVPFYIFIPVYAFARLAPQLSAGLRQQVWYQRMCALLLVITLLFNTLPLGLDPLRGKTGYMHLPYDRIAEAVKKEALQADRILVNSIGFAGNLSLNLGNEYEVLVWNDVIHGKHEIVPVVGRTHLYVWPADGEHVNEMMHALKSMPGFNESAIRYVELPYHVPKGKLFRMAILNLSRQTND